MAHFAATGPFGRVCSECTHYGCYEQIHNVAGDLVKTEHHPRACAKFLSLTGKLGPAIPAETEACRHFRER
jgi:hypothetical protein